MYFQKLKTASFFQIILKYHREFLFTEFSSKSNV